MNYSTFRSFTRDELPQFDTPHDEEPYTTNFHTTMFNHRHLVSKHVILHVYEFSYVAKCLWKLYCYTGCSHVELAEEKMHILFRSKPG